MISCITMTVVLLVLSVNSVALYKQIDELNKESVGKLNAEWSQLYRLSEMVDKYYIKNDFQDPSRYHLFVYQTAHHFTGRPDVLTVNMRNLLVLAYDPVFTDLSLKEGPLNKDEATKLLTHMNDDIMLISRGIIDMQDDDKEELLDPTSSEFIEVSTQVEDTYNKYMKLVDNYFKNNKK